MVAVSAAGLTACTVEPATSGLGVTSTSSTGGSAGASTSSSSSTTTTTGTAGSTSSAGGASGATTSSGAAGSDAGNAGGSGGSGGAAVDGGMTDVSVEAAPSDASEGGSAACFEDDVPGSDAGMPQCSLLAYYAVACTDDAGGTGMPLGADICDYYRPNIKIAAFNELFDCLKTVPGDDAGTTACSDAHDAAASACANKIFNRASCPVPDVTLDGGTYGCAQVVASCPADGGVTGITLDQCQGWVAPFNAATRQAIFDCYLDPGTGAGSTSCADKFENDCVFP